MQNPVVRGFNPDPSIIRIGEDYYIATSTFEWFPGVNIYHSKDLKNWELHSRVLNDERFVNLDGVPDGGGIWAPCLSYDGEKIYLVYTVVKERGAMMQTDNYLIETDDIDKGWSDRVYLNSIGFDPSLFHDDDGKKYLVSLENHYEKGKRFNGLYIEEYDPIEKKLVGGRRRLYEEKNGELVEGAHVYKKDGTYYLLKAQGGTGVMHSAQVSRSESLFGKWEDDEKILLHSRGDMTYPLLKAGHADIVEDGEENWYMVHLASRGLFSLAGRETCIQKVVWKDGWLRLESGGEKPETEIFDGTNKRKNEFYDFTKGDFEKDFQFLRTKNKNAVRVTEKGLEIKGGSVLMSRFDQNLIARRIDEENIGVETKMEFCPESEREMAGMVFYYDSRHWYYGYVTNKNGVNKAKLLGCDEGELIYFDNEIEVEESVTIAAKIEEKTITFFVDGKMLASADAKILTDEHVHLGFTGAMVGINCIDCEKRVKKALYKYFKYERN